MRKPAGLNEMPLSRKLILTILNSRIKRLLPDMLVSKLTKQFCT